MTSLVLAIWLGASLGALVWVGRSWIAERWARDVAWLEHAVWRFTPSGFDGRPFVTSYWALVIGLFAAGLISPMRTPLLIILVVLLFVPRTVFSIAWSKRRKAIEGQLPDAVRQISSSVAAGMTLVQAIERLAERAATPIRAEFRIMANHWNLGSDMTAIIEEARRRLNLANFNLFASAVVVNQRMGGNVTETLNQLADALDEIDRMKKRIKVETAEGRTNVKVLLVVPLVMLGFITLIDREAVGMLFTTTLGQIMLGVALALTVTGFAWAWRIVHADV